MRSKDRLLELRRAAAAAGGGEWRASGEYSQPLLPAGDGATDPGPGPGGAHHDPEMEALLEEAERARGWIHEITRNAQLVRRLHQHPAFHTTPQLQGQVDAAATQSTAAGLKVCGALRQLEARAACPGPACAGAGVLQRMARLQSAATRRLYARALDEHHAALHALRDDQLALLRKQLTLTNVSLSDDECEALLDTDNIAMFVDNVRAETAEARRVLRDVEARHEELARVERALRDVRDLFHQLGHIIALQQEQVDTVEQFAVSAGAHVEDGGRDLMKGAVKRSGARQKKLSLLVCVAAGALVVLLVLVFT